MLMYTRLTVAVAALLFVAACNQDPTAVSSNELALAQNAQVITDNFVASPSSANNGMSCEGLFRRLLDTLRTTDNTQARADLVQAQAYRDSAFAARMAGDTASARSYRQLAFRSVLSAVIELFPNAPARTAAAAATPIARIHNFLGDTDGPRIRPRRAHGHSLP